VKWYSSNTAVATVTDDGKVEAKTAGEATIIATTTRSGRTVQCAVTVLPANSDKEPVLRVTLTPAASQLSITIGKENNVLTHVTREDDRSYTPALRGVTNSAEVLLSANVEWVTNNAAIATVSSTGVVSGVTPGTTRIYAISVEGARTAYRDVTVSGVPVTGITLAGTVGADMTTAAGRAARAFTATITPGNAWDKTVNWTSSATGIATISASSNTPTNGTTSTAATVAITVTPVLTGPAGGATITARTSNNISATRTVSLTRLFSQASIPATTGTGVTIQNQTVSLTSYYMGHYEVTQGNYKTVIGSIPGGIGLVGDNYPINYITRHQVLVFCNRLSVLEGLSPAYEMQPTSAGDNGDATTAYTVDTSQWGTPPTGYGGSATRWLAARIVAGSTGYRLPTTNEWEYACRGGVATVYSYYYVANGNGSSYGSNTWDQNYGVVSVEPNINTLKQVGTKWCNGYGLYDMHGNVWEMTNQLFGSGVSRQVVLMGGSFRAGEYNASATYRNGNGSYYGLQSSSSDWSYPYAGYIGVGMRVIRPRI
jgi:formylglycine-generating enzyme required for sulfatase activity